MSGLSLDTVFIPGSAITTSRAGFVVCKQEITIQALQDNALYVYYQSSGGDIKHTVPALGTATITPDSDVIYIYAEKAYGTAINLTYN